MAKTIHVSCVNNYQSSTANTTEYWDYNSNPLSTATEAKAQIKVYTAGTFSRLRVRVATNSIAGGTTTFTFRKNGADGNQVVSIPASTTGLYETAGGTSDTVVSGDLINLKSVPGGATGQVGVPVLACNFDTGAVSNTDSETYMVLANNYAYSFLTAASTTWYFTPHGYLDFWFASGTTETSYQINQNKAGTYKNMSCYIRTNSRASTSTLRLRKNAGNGNLTVPITAGSTGLFEDISNNDTVVNNDKVCYSFTNGTGAGNAIDIQHMACEFHTAGNPGIGQLTNSNNTTTDASQAKATTAWTGIAGVNPTGATESLTQVSAGEAFTFSFLSINVTVNALTGAGTLKLRVAGADSALSVPIPATTTGMLVDTTNTVTVAAANLLGLQLTTGTNAVAANMSYGDTNLYTSIAGEGPPIVCNVTGKSISNRFEV